MTLAPQPLPMKEYYIQRNEIVALFGYRLWSEIDHPLLLDKAAQLASRDVTPAFILTELIVFLNSQKIVRPGYTPLQTIISNALTAERRRLEQSIARRFWKHFWKANYLAMRLRLGSESKCR